MPIIEIVDNMKKIFGIRITQMIKELMVEKRDAQNGKFSMNGNNYNNANNYSSSNNNEQI